MTDINKDQERTYAEAEASVPPASTAENRTVDRRYPQTPRIKNAPDVPLEQRIEGAEATLHGQPNREAEEVEANAGITLHGRYLPPPKDGDGKRWVRTTALIASPPERLYELWRDLETVPMWQEQIEEVRMTGPKTSHWVMVSNDKRIEWDAEIMADEPNKRIAWRSIAGDSENAGEVVFEKSFSDRGTMVTVVQEFRMGALESFWQTVTGRNPKQAVIENLRHLKAYAETGEIPRTQGQPHGPRGVTGEMKKSLYGENVPTPQGKLREAS
jgi:uncharacterized membrane protein